MKKLFIILLAFLLCGCAAQQEPIADSEAAQPADGKPAVTLYIENSEAEKASDGAIRTYMLDAPGAVMLLPFEEKLIAVSAQGDLTLLQGADGQVVATASTELSAAWGVEDLCAGKQKVAYYALDTREVVVLDEMLNEQHRIQLPEDIQGRPIIQLDQAEVYYCVADAIHAVNIHSGVSRMLRSHDCVSQELLGAYFGGEVLGCMISDSQGMERIIYLDTQTGQELASDLSFTKLETFGDRYYGVLPEAQGHRIVFGMRGKEQMRLDISAAESIPVLAADGVVEATEEADVLQLKFYSLAEGLCTGAVTIPAAQVDGITATQDGFVWILSGSDLYRWDVTKSSCEDDTVYSSVVYTQDAPDLEGLEACQQRVEELENAYGFTLEIWEEAAQSAEAYGAEAEYHVKPIEQMLSDVETVLSKLPKDFLSITGDVHVCLVRSLQEQKSRALFWADGTCYLLLTANETEESFLWGLGNAVDTRVLGNSFDYDKWDELNPWWFDYTYDYEENLHRNDPEDCLSGKNRYFTDIVAMSYPTEDRSRLFANALMDDNAEIFASDPMQKKLKTLCVAIREAYGWEDSTEVYSWEQYLERSIAAEE